MYLTIGLLIILIITYFLNKEKFVKGVNKALIRDWKVTLLFLLALIIAYYVGVFFNNINIKSLLSNNNLINIITGTLLGFIFPGPRYIIYPFISEFITIGFGTGFIVALLYSQQLLTQPDGTILQVKYLGWKYSIYFSILMVIMIILFTLLFKNLFIIQLDQTAIKPISQSSNLITFMINNLIDLMPILLLAICLSGVLSEWVKPSDVKRLNSILIASILGVITPGPIYEVYPFLGALRKKGMPLYLITAFTIGQASFGPIRALLEVKILGWLFVTVRLLITILLAVSGGLITKLFENTVLLKD